MLSITDDCAARAAVCIGAQNDTANIYFWRQQWLSRAAGAIVATFMLSAAAGMLRLVVLK